jgi:hypothetical protein
MGFSSSFGKAIELEEAPVVITLANNDLLLHSLSLKRVGVRTGAG